jgi:hypothetical protein
MSYNGWTNYATWAVALWLDNTAPSYHHWREDGKECVKEARGSIPEQG